MPNSKSHHGNILDLLGDPLTSPSIKVVCCIWICWPFSLLKMCSLGSPALTPLVLFFFDCPLSLLGSFFSTNLLKDVFSSQIQSPALFFFFAYFFLISYLVMVSPITYLQVMSDLHAQFLSPKLNIHVPGAHWIATLNGFMRHLELNSLKPNLQSPHPVPDSPPHLSYFP